MTTASGGVFQLEKYIEEMRLRQWANVIRSANESRLPRTVWLEQNGIPRYTFYYWLNKVRTQYAEQNGLIPIEKEKNHVTERNFVEVPIVQSDTIKKDDMVPAAIIHIDRIYVEISPTASAEFLDNLGRMIHNAL